jgi:hypothetical protein
MNEKILKIKLPANYKTVFKHTKKITVLDKFYSWVKASIGESLDYKIEVSEVHVNKAFEIVLNKMVSKNVKTIFPNINERRHNGAVAMEMLCYSPSTRLTPPEDEVWVVVSK